MGHLLLAMPICFTSLVCAQDNVHTPDSSAIDAQVVEKFHKQVQAYKNAHNGAVLKDAGASKVSHRTTQPFSEIVETYGMADIQPQIDPMDPSAPWQMLTQSVLNLISGGQPRPGMQIIASPVSASWNDPTTGQFLKFRVVGDTQPQWGQLYIPSTLQVTNGYRAFINNLAIPTPDSKVKKQVDDAKKKYDNTLNAMEGKEETVLSKWVIYDKAQKAAGIPPAQQKTFQQWYAQYGAPQLAAEQQDVNLAAQTYNSYLARAYQGYGFVSSLFTDFDNPAYQQTAVDDNNNGYLYRVYNITPDLNSFVQASKALPDNAGPRLSFSFSKNSGRLDTTNTSWGGSASYFGFISVGASGSTATVDTHSDHFAMQMSAKNYQTFTITPGPWFNATAIQAFQCGPWIADGPVAKGTTILWGKNGILSLLPAQIVVAYKPKVVLTLGADNYHSVKTSVSASGGFSIGPFGFGASYHRDTSHVDFNDATGTITAEDTSDVPQIVAVISNFLPNSTYNCH
ncbi:MAG: hypothetical protein WBQ76_05660 [Candidatus Korobacteraceae bacterium]